MNCLGFHPSYDFSTVALALIPYVSSVANDSKVFGLVGGLTLARWTDTLTGAKDMLEYLNNNRLNYDMVAAVRNALMRTGARYLFEAPVTPKTIIAKYRPQFVSSITLGGFHETLMSHMPSIGAMKAHNIKVAAGRDPASASNDLLDTVIALEIWNEFIPALKSVGLGHLAQLFTSGPASGGAPASAPPPSTYASPTPALSTYAANNLNTGAIFQRKKAARPMHEWNLVSLGKSGVCTVVPESSLPDPIITEEDGREFLEMLTETVQDNPYHGTQIGLYGRIESLEAASAMKSRFVEHAVFESNPKPAAAPTGISKVIMPSAGSAIPTRTTRTVIRGGVKFTITEGENLPDFLVLVRDESGKYETMLPGDDKPFTNPDQALAFAKMNKKHDPKSDYAVYMLGPTNVKEEVEVSSTQHVKIFERKKPAASAASTPMSE
jgi:hypothetical protein